MERQRNAGTPLPHYAALALRSMRAGPNWSGYEVPPLDLLRPKQVLFLHELYPVGPIDGREIVFVAGLA
jgi:hypothetical protein